MCKILQDTSNELHLEEESVRQTRLEDETNERAKETVKRSPQNQEKVYPTEENGDFFVPTSILVT